MGCEWYQVLLGSKFILTNSDTAAELSMSPGMARLAGAMHGESTLKLPPGFHCLVPAHIVLNALCLKNHIKIKQLFAQVRIKTPS